MTSAGIVVLPLPKKRNPVSRVWAAEPVVISIVLPALGAIIAGVALYSNGAGTGGPTTGLAGAVAAILGLLVRAKVTSPARIGTVTEGLATSQKVLRTLQELQLGHEAGTAQMLSSVSELAKALPVATGHEELAPWVDPAVDLPTDVLVPASSSLPPVLVPIAVVPEPVDLVPPGETTAD